MVTFEEREMLKLLKYQAINKIYQQILHFIEITKKAGIDLKKKDHMDSISNKVRIINLMKKHLDHSQTEQIQEVGGMILKVSRLNEYKKKLRVLVESCNRFPRIIRNYLNREQIAHLELTIGDIERILLMPYPNYILIDEATPYGDIIWNSIVILSGKGRR